MKKQIAKPRAFKEKSMIPLWSFYTLVPRADRELASDGVHWRACGANMDSIAALQVDYDSGIMTIDQFVTDHAFDYALYTSPSHTDEHEKFRVIIPLAQPLLNAYLGKGKVRNYLLEMFPECDQTTINSFRKQRMPAQPMSGCAYRYHINEGARLALDMAEIARLFSVVEAEENIAETVDLSTEIDPFDTPIGQMDTIKELHRLMGKYREELEILKNTPRGGGTVHYALTRMCAGLQKAGLSFDDAVAFFGGYGFSGNEINRIMTWQWGRR